MDITQIIESAQQAHEAITTTVSLYNETAQTFAEMGNSSADTITLLAAGDTSSTTVTGKIVNMGAYIGAGLAMVGACGVGAGQGYAAGAAALAVSRNPEVKPAIMSTMIVGMAIAESAAIYALIIAILLIFVAPGM